MKHSLIKLIVNQFFVFQKNFNLLPRTEISILIFEILVDNFGMS
jgi:hypothetical protein